MADLVFNQAKGAFAEYARRVNNNDPTNAVFQFSLWNTTETDANIRDLDTIALIESNANTAELTSGGNANYARKTLDQTGGLTITVDDTNDRVDVDAPDQTWTALGAGTAITDLASAYDSDSAAGTDANIIPVTWHDFAITPDGSDVTAQIAVFGRAA